MARGTQKGIGYFFEKVACPLVLSVSMSWNGTLRETGGALYQSSSDNKRGGCHCYTCDDQK